MRARRRSSGGSCRSGRGSSFPYAAPDGARRASSRRRARTATAPTTTPTGPAASRPAGRAGRAARQRAAARRCGCWPSPSGGGSTASPTSRGGTTPCRAGDLRRQPPQPPRLARSSSRRCPEPWRHKVFVGAAADYFFTNPVSSAASALALNAIPIEREGVSRRSVGQAEALLADGWSLVLFPEGGRSPDGWGQPHKPGAAWLAQRIGRRRWCPSTSPAPVASSPRAPRSSRPAAAIVTFGARMRCGDERGRPRLRRPHRGRHRRPGRRVHRRLVRRPPPRPRRQTHRRSPAPSWRSWRRAWALGDRKGRPTKHQAQLARARKTAHSRTGRSRRRVTDEPAPSSGGPVRETGGRLIS